MSNREQIAQVAQRKWAIMSDSLRSLRGNEWCEWIAHFTHEKWANERFAQKIWLKKSKSLFYYVLLYLKFFNTNIFAHFLFFGERCQWIPHFAQIKWAMWANPSFRSLKMNDSLRLLRGNERCERIAHFAHQKWANEWIAHFFEWIAHLLIFWFPRKSNERIPSPIWETPPSWRYSGYTTILTLSGVHHHLNVI